jgi:hypothetical protein
VRTSSTSVAERAGVSQPRVYRLFADEQSTRRRVACGNGVANGVEAMNADREPVIDGEIVEDEAVRPAAPPGDYTPDGVPTFEHVRDRVESRIATSAGAGELAAATPEAETAEDRFEARQRAGRDRLEEIRRSMRGDA